MRELTRFTWIAAAVAAVFSLAALQVSAAAVNGARIAISAHSFGEQGRPDAANLEDAIAAPSPITWPRMRRTS